MDALERITSLGYVIFVRHVDDDTSHELDDFVIENNILLITVNLGDDVVAEAEFTDDGESFHCDNVRVQQSHQRNGIATAMYVKAEQVKQMVLDNFWDGTDTQTDEARALWANPNRPFGSRQSQLR